MSRYWRQSIGFPWLPLWLAGLALLLGLLSTLLLPEPSPREQYARALTNAGLRDHQLLRQWHEVATTALAEPTIATLPLVERVWLAADAPAAFAYGFELSEHQVLHLRLEQPPETIGRVFADLYQRKEGEWQFRKALTAPHDAWEISSSGEYGLLIQPELLSAGRLDIVIEVHSPLEFPVSGKDNRAILSFWGAPRDGGRRRHEGVDVFAPRGTPVVAVAAGKVARVGDSRLGGLHVWQKDAGRPQSYYYAHLSKVHVEKGDDLEAGELLGLVGNSGNARTTPPHLHFGVYRRLRGAIDPFPLISKPAPVSQDFSLPASPPQIYQTVSANRLNMRSGPGTRFPVRAVLPRDVNVQVLAAAPEWLRVRTAAGQQGYVSASFLNPLTPRHVMLSGSLRRFPSKEAPELGYLSGPSQLWQVAAMGEFYQVEWGGRLVWIASGLER